MDGSHGEQINREFIVEHSGTDDVFPRGEIGQVGSRGREATIDFDFSFVQNEFPGGQAFKLSGLEVYHELNGKTFDELNETFQEIILDYR